MAKTELHNYTVQEKLNKMDVDIIDITATLSTSGAADSVMFLPTEIPNCVSVNGGTSLLHSVVAIVANNATDTSSAGASCLEGFRCVFTSDATITDHDTAASLALQDVTTAEGSIVGNGGFGVPRADLTGTCGVVPIAGASDFGFFGLHYASNCGSVLKAASGSTSLYVWGIASGTTNYAGATITLRIGVIKD